MGTGRLLREKHTFSDGKYKENNREGEVLISGDLCLQKNIFYKKKGSLNNYREKNKGCPDHIKTQDGSHRSNEFSHFNVEKWKLW